jgi:hypothetical protein
LNYHHYKKDKAIANQKKNIAHGTDEDTNETIFLVSWKRYLLDKAT